MSLFLLQFNRDTRRVVVEQFDDQESALRRLSDAEKEARQDRALEVVLLTAADEADLRKTHSRYFETFEELLAGVRS